jgi:hypothetical protein
MLMTFGCTLEQYNILIDVACKTGKIKRVGNDLVAV